MNESTPRRDGLDGPAASASARILSFVVIGASKSGTTALFRYLRTDPDLYLPADKDAPFFAVDEFFEGGWEAFAATYFAAAPPGALLGTVTPRYMEDPRVPGRIAERMPDVRLIAILRNPIDRAYSQYRQQVRRGKELLSFGDLVERLLAAQAWEDRAERILAPGHYARALKPFFELFPRQRLLVVFGEELASDPQSVIDRIRIFLGLQPGFTPPNLGKRYHVGGERQRFPGLIPALRKVAPLRRLWRLLPRRRRAGLWTWFFTQANVVEEAPEPIPPALRERLVAHYREDIEDLEELIGRPVPWQELRRPEP